MVSNLERTLLFIYKEQLINIELEGETEKMKKAQAVTDSAFAHIVEWLDPGRTELEVALEIEFFMRAHGAESTAFAPSRTKGRRRK